MPFDINQQIQGVAANIAAKVLEDNLDMIDIVSSGGTTGNEHLDSAIRGFTGKAKEIFIRKNWIYFALYTFTIIFLTKKLLK